MFSKYPKPFLRQVISSLTELLSGDKKLGCYGLCRFLFEETKNIEIYYSFVDDFMTRYNVRCIYISGEMTEDRVLLARKIISETRKYLGE